MIKERWPLWVKVLLAPIALIGALLSLPVAILMIFADFDKTNEFLD